MVHTADRNEKTVKNIASDIENKAQRGEEKVKGMLSDLDSRIKESTEKVKQAASEVDRHLREKPWPFVAGVAVSFLLLGFIMGNSKRNR